MLREQAQFDRLCRIAERHAAGLDDFAGHPERDVLLAGLVLGELAIGGDRAEGVEIRHARFGVLRRNRAAADVVAQIDERLADPELTFDPTVLLVGLTIVQLEEQAEPPAVDRLGKSSLPRELCQRCGRDKRDVAAPSIDGEPGSRLHQAKRAAGPARERVGPGAHDDVPGHRAAVEVGRDLLAGRNRPVGNRSVREAERQPPALGVVLRRDPDELAVAELVVAAALRIDDVEAPIRSHAGFLERHRVRVDEREPLDGRDRDPAYEGHADTVCRGRVSKSVPVPGTGAKPSRKRKRSRPARKSTDRVRHRAEMPRPPRNAYPGGFFHTGTGGNNRSRAFLDSLDRHVFMRMFDRSERKYTWRGDASWLLGTDHHPPLSTPDGGRFQGMRQVYSSRA